jgi:hypothetical protein
VCKEETPATRTKYLQDHFATKKVAIKKQNKLQKNTHTKNGVIPPIMVTIIERHLIRFQP